MRTRALIVAGLPAVFAAVFAAGCGGGGDSADSGPIVDAPPGQETFSVELVMTTGNLIIDVTRASAPNGADRFRELVEDGFYDDCRFFRVIPGFVAQFGINGEPATQAMWTGQTIPDDPVVLSNVRGAVTFAQTSSPNSRSTQLFINYVDNSRLDSMGFAPFGVVRTGMANADALTGEYGEQPQQPRVTAEGNTYLDADFPNLDSIISARVIP